MTHDVFISYSNKDKPIADGICANLESAGFRCWIAPRDIAPGEDWPTAISLAVSKSRVMVLVFSSHSNKSDEVSRELFLAANYKVIIIPFKIEDVEPEAGKQYYLGRTHWLDAMNPPTKEQIRILVQRVKSCMAVEEVRDTDQPTSIAGPTAPPSGSKTAAPPRRFQWRYLMIPGALMVLALLVWAVQGILPKQPTQASLSVTLTPATASTSTSAPTSTLTPVPTSMSTLVSTITLTAMPTPEPGSTQISPKDGMVMVNIPAGEFLMGATDYDADAKPDEKPQHKVYLDAYWIDKTDVTNAMFARFVAATNYKTRTEEIGTGGVCGDQSSPSGLVAGNDWLHPCGPSSNIQGKDDHPVVQVTWYDAKTYCEWTGRRLLTEAEWEKAARGTDGRKYPWGNNGPDKTLLNFNMQVGDTTKVGLYPPGASPYGVLDMAGNVWQWIGDWYTDTFYAISPDRNPRGPTSGEARVMRGGSWAYAAWAMRTTSREIWGEPDARYSDIGFRCALSP